MTEEDIRRINELYHKRKAGTITKEELIEHDRLRREYILAIRASLRANLDNTTIVNPDGSTINLAEKYKNTSRSKEDTN